MKEVLTKFSIIVSLLLTFQLPLRASIFSPPQTTTNSQDLKSDLFEQFALQKNTHVPGLEPNLERELPAKVMSWDTQIGKGFKPMEKIWTQKQLDAELKIMRKRYRPFLRKLAPAPPVTRKRKELNIFQWRLESSVMEPFAVQKEWEEVTIPHYTGPINQASACYRKELTISQDQLKADKLFLHFNAADYVTHVYVNGQKAGEHTGLFGAFEFDIKPFVHIGQNTLEVRVFNDAVMMGDFFNTGPGRNFGKKLAACGGPGWDNPDFGWHMCPPGFGLWQSCYLETRSNTYINSLFVRPLIEEGRAEVWAELPEGSDDLSISYSLYGQNFNSTIAERKGVESVDIVPAPAMPGFKLFKFSVPVPKDQLKLWTLDEPWLYQVQVFIRQKGKLLDVATRNFGMRSFTQSKTSKPKGRFYLNGKEIKLRGANMMGNIMQCVMRKDYDQLIDDILLAKIANMTFWRMTQQPCQKEAYEYFDQLGLLVQTDFPTFNGIRKDAVETAKEQFVEMVRLVRGHPSNIMLSYLNEPDFTKPMMLDREGHEMLFSSFDAAAEVLNPGQVTKWVDGDYVNLSHQYSDHHNYNMWYGNGIRNTYFGNWSATREGWMHACGEFGAEGLDHVKLMKKYYPDEWLEPDAGGGWAPDAIPRCQTPTIGMKWQMLKNGTMEDWVSSSQRHQMWAMRLFTESLRRDYKMNSFAIHLLIDAWPAGWLKAVMDCDRQAKPAYFAYKDALSPLAINLRPDSFYGFSGEKSKIGVWVCNDLPKSFDRLNLQYQLEFENEVIKTGHATVSAPASAPEFQGWLEMELPDVPQKKALTVRVSLSSKKGKPIHESDVQLEVYPITDKRKQLVYPGGAAQQLIEN